MIRNLITLIIIGVLLFVTYVYAVTRNLPDVEVVLQNGINPTKWTQILANDGTPIMSLGKFHHVTISIKEVSPSFLEALIATEDRRFYQHFGVDPAGLARALIKNVTEKDIKEGGSTITQQLARNAFLNSERTLARKVRECALAIKIEQKLTKDQILELYINNTYFGEGAYGIKAASQIYFGKLPGQLTIAEGAMLAGLPQAPSGYSPFQNITAATRRRNEVLQNLVEVEKITQEDYAKYSAVPIQLSHRGGKLADSDKAPFFNRYVLNRVMKLFNLDEQSFWQSGLKVYTTLDLNAQRLAEQTVTSQLRAAGRTRDKEEGALVSIDTKSGEILAYVGGKSYTQSQFDRVSQAIRSPGSLFKIFTYTTAIDQGLEPRRVYLDEPFSLGEWHPQNYDKQHHGHMTLARALITSNNIIAVKLIQELGPESVVNMAELMGIHTPMSPYPGLTLGGSGVKLLEITSAFGVLANQGVRVEPHGITRIIDDTGRELFREKPEKTNVLNRSTVDTMVRMMQGVIEKGTGVAASINRPAAGKTGTSDNHHDAWFVGFTPDVVTGVWIGNDDNTPMNGMTGGALPAQLWKAFMQSYMGYRPVQNFDLAYSKTLNPEDFITYNAKNIAPTEGADNFYSSDRVPLNPDEAPSTLEPFEDVNRSDSAASEVDAGAEEPDQRRKTGADRSANRRSSDSPPETRRLVNPLEPELDTEENSMAPLPGHDR
jgi:penicillin-binding protein 1A